MLIALVLLTLAATLVVFMLLGLLLVGIRREDRAPELASRAPTLVTALTRHLVGLHVRRPTAAESVGEVRPRACPACDSTSHRRGGIA
jgi:hypothetical protein